VTIKVNLQDGLLDVPAQMPLKNAFERAAQLGLLAPFPKPKSDINATDLLLRCPLVGDAFVHSCSLRGKATPQAPRSAVGIDPIGGIMLGFEKAERIIFRGLALSRACITTQTFKNTDALTDFLFDVMAAGKYFSLLAHKNVCLMMGGDYVSQSDDNSGANDWLDALAKQNLPLSQRAPRSLNPADAEEIKNALNSNTCLLGAPYMGRLGMYEESAHPSVELFAGLRRKATPSKNKKAVK